MDNNYQTLTMTHNFVLNQLLQLYCRIKQTVMAANYAPLLDLSKKGRVLKCEEVRAFSRYITSKTITYQFSIGFINVYRSRKAIFYFQDL